MCIRDSCITHLPQIAAMSERHFRVSKNELNGYNFAEIKSLSENEKVEEVAKLISGEKVTNASLPVSYTHLRAHETVLDIVCRLLLEKKKYKSQYSLIIR